MNRAEQSKLIWVPRIIAMALALFLLAFSLEAFPIEGAAVEKMAGFVAGLLPGLLVVAVLWLSWKRPLWGGWAAIALAAIFCRMVSHLPGPPSPFRCFRCRC